MGSSLIYNSFSKIEINVCIVWDYAIWIRFSEYLVCRVMFLNKYNINIMQQEH
jgi:hypothetical protein